MGVDLVVGNAPVTPLVFARQKSAQPQPLHILHRGFAERFARIVPLLESLELDARAELTDWVERCGAEEVGRFLDNNLSGFDFFALWRSKEESGRRWSLFEALVIEEHVAGRIHEIGSYARTYGAGIERVLVRIREVVGQTAFHHARKLGRGKPFVFVRTLELARRYFSWALDVADHYQRPPRLLRARLGMVTVMAARHGHTDLAALERAIEELRLALEEDDSVLVYLLEALTLQYDITNDIEALRSAARLSRGKAVGFAGFDVWIRLGGESRASAAFRLACIAEAEAHLSAVRPSEAADRVRLRMSRALAVESLAAHRRGSILPCRGLSLPFFDRGAIPLSEAELRDLAPAFVRALEGEASTGDYLARDLAARLCSLLGKGATGAARRDWLRRAITLREGTRGQKPLRHHESILGLCIDQLELAYLVGDVATRRRAIERLRLLHLENPSDATSLTVIAREIEDRGALRGALISGGNELSVAVRNGDHHALLGMAARRALASVDTRRRRIGGRGGAQVIVDARGVTATSFVFKQTNQIVFERDSQRTSEIATALLLQGDYEQFGVIEHLACFNDADGAVTSVRRFIDGTTLDEALHSATPYERLDLLRRTARFLAFIHSLDSTGKDERCGARRDVWEREVGYWLRWLDMPQERQRFFNSWWEVLSAGPLLRRRDAHACNWLLVEGDRLIAVDLESTGWRPAGYELAQLTDDGPYLSPRNVGDRRLVFDTYCDELTKLGVAHDRDQVWESYLASLLGRAIRTLHAAVRSGVSATHAVGLTEQLARSQSEMVRTLATEVLDAWASLTGRAGTRAAGRLVSEGTRRRISTAMAYTLRHNRNASLSAEGWMHVDELVESLRAEGHRVSRSQILSIAGAVGEPRFERDADEIRARYGHSVKVQIDYEPEPGSPTLYHATPLRNLPSIVEAKDGLRPGKRNWVHMSDEPATALRASVRQRQPVVLMEVRGTVDGLRRGAAHTWLAPYVPIDDMRIVPLWRVGELDRGAQGI